MGAGKSLVNKNPIHTLTVRIVKEGYTAPEVISNTPKIDWHKADVFSLGKVV